MKKTFKQLYMSTLILVTIFSIPFSKTNASAKNNIIVNGNGNGINNRTNQGTTGVVRPREYYIYENRVSYGNPSSKIYVTKMYSGVKYSGYLYLTDYFMDDEGRSVANYEGYIRR